MSNIELAKTMLDKLPEDKIIFIINILENIYEFSGLEYEPNQDTLEAIEEVDNMIKNNTGEAFDGSTSDFFARLEE
jgi:hypothetical protein|nr:MAG TPA: hypothetical protein [Caudoviricetes sp.]DAU22358.1 MAG TPA: hypothetical protein [Caudoviricetes sp.]